MNVLYISYDGALDLLGSSQIIPYLLGLSRRGVSFTLLTFEKKENLNDRDRVSKLKNILKEKNIKWEALRYHKSPSLPATIFDVIAGAIKGLIIVLREDISVIHARSFIGAIPALLLAKSLNLKFIFDMRGFWPEERVEGGLWGQNCLVFKIAKLFEKKLILNAHHIVVLSYKAKEIMQERYLNRINNPIEVIPTCVDLGLFFPKEKNSINSAIPGVENKFIFTYLGSLGTWYCLEEMIDFFKVAKQKIANAYFIFLTPGSEKQVEGIMLAKGLSSNDFTVREISYREVPDWLSISDASLFFIRPSFSKKSSSPTKLAESLACGVPVLTNSGIGDCDEVINNSGAGVLVKDFSEASYLEAIDKLGSILRDRRKTQEVCRKTAQNIFSLESGVDKYFGIYQTLI